jgi:hypothetical protein
MDNYNQSVSAIQEQIRIAEPQIAEAKRMIALAEKAGQNVMSAKQKLQAAESQLNRWKQAIASS